MDEKKKTECKVQSYLSKLSLIPPLLTRISVGWVFLESGLGKMKNIPKVVEFFTELGIPAPHLQAPFVAGVELVGGALLIGGLATRLISVPLIATMVVAIATAKREDIASISDLFGFSEFLYILLLVWLIVCGPGCLSLDFWLGKRFCKKKE